MAKPKKTGSSLKKKPIEQYAHNGKKRANNPPVGLVAPATDSQWASVLAAAIRDTRDISKGNLSVLSALTRDTVLFSDSILKAYRPVKNIRAK
jgi:hypothetical protein